MEVRQSNSFYTQNIHCYLTKNQLIKALSNSCLIALFLMLFINMPVQAQIFDEAIVEQQRARFVLLEKQIQKRKNPLSFSSADGLDGYPLYPYLKYQWLIKNLKESHRVKNFLAEHKDSRYANILKNKWLLHLARHKQWPEFMQHYRQTNNTKIQCYFYHAQYKAGAKQDALIAAKKIWVRGRSQPAACNAVFKALKKSSYFTREMLWQRFNNSVDNRKIKLARYVKGLMNKKDQAIADTWLKVHANPSLVTKANFLNPKDAQAGLIFAHGIDRLARKNFSTAIKIWDKRKQDFKITEDKVNHVEQRLAMKLAYRRDKRAYARLSQLKKPEEKAQEWRIRIALRNQDWPSVEQSINAADTEIKAKEKWRYWFARAMEESDDSKVASFIYKQLSSERSFYGYLSAEKINRPYQLSDKPVEVAPGMLKRLKNKEDFRVVAELVALKRSREVKRQWRYALKKLDKKRILVAAKYAQELNQNQLAIISLAKVKYWDDISLRFPLAYKSQVHKNAKEQKLNPAVIYGLIRRESAFDKNAESPVGAKGLMQIMPKTGQQIARELKDKWVGAAALFDPILNVRYGAYYYKQLLKQFDNHYALAAAGYNAGPHRVKAWSPKKGVMAADVWVETIPFNETRAYVSAVLTYALIYQKKLGKDTLSMKDFMRDVRPR